MSESNIKYRDETIVNIYSSVLVNVPFVINAINDPEHGQVLECYHLDGRLIGRFKTQVKISPHFAFLASVLVERIGEDTQIEEGAGE